MQKKIADTTATDGLGSSMQAKLFAIATGNYAGRRVALIQSSPNEIKLAWSDAPSAGWSSPSTVAADAGDCSFDARMASNGDIYLVYSEQTTSYLVTRRLTFSSGLWSVGTKVIVYSGTQCFDPSIAIEPGGRVWVSFSRFVTPNRWIHVKASNDSGATWGSGANDAGDQISNGSMFAWSKIVIDASRVRVVYHDQDWALYVRSQPLSGGIWSSAVTVANGSSLSSFDAAVGADNRLGIAWCGDQFYYRESYGDNWGAVAVIESHPIVSPQVLFEGNIAAIVYLDDMGGDMKVARFCDRRTGNFGSSKILDGRSAPFDSVLLYHAASATYQDVTSQAVSWVAGDVYHASSGCLLKDAGDTMYLGMDAPFRVARLILSQTGAGGSIQISYWDGANWEAFTPASGNPNLGSSASDILMWTDYASLPDDWQKRLVNSRRRYWVKIEVISGFSTGPIASQISAAADATQMIFRR